jgi:hypothetical protein
MKRLCVVLVFGLVAIALAAPAYAQSGHPLKAPVAASKGDLAMALVRISSTGPASGLTAESALDRVRSAALFPRGWAASDTLTQADLAVVARSLGVSFTPSDSDRSVTSAELDTFVLRELAPKRDAVASAMGAGRVIDPILDEPPNRFVSASDF